MADSPVYLLDVNVLLALLSEDHAQHELADEWFNTPGVQWALCAFTEAGVLRFFTRPKTGELNMVQAKDVLKKLMQHPGYLYQPITESWETLTAPFSKRIHGHNQITDAYLLGLAIREGLVLTTFDKAILHLAREHRDHVLLLEQS